MSSAHAGSLANQPHVFLDVLPEEKNWNMWLRTAGYVTDTVSEIKEFRYKATNPSPGDITKYPPPLPRLIRNFANENATNPRDKVRAFMGTAKQEYNNMIPINYNKDFTKAMLFTTVARAFFRKVLIPLLWIESPARLVTPDSPLPSWVPDYTAKQGLIPKVFVSTLSSFDADRSFLALPSEDKEPRAREPLDCEVLTIRGIYIGIITGVEEARITQDDDLK
jgi:hypothetical protein